MNFTSRQFDVSFHTQSAKKILSKGIICYISVIIMGSFNVKKLEEIISTTPCGILSQTRLDISRLISFVVGNPDLLTG